MVHTPGHKSRSSSVRKPGDPPVRPRPVRGKSPKKPKLSPKSKIMTAKTEAGIRKAKRKAKTVTNAPVDMSGVRRMPNRSMADAGAAATKAFKELFEGPKTPITYNPTRKKPTKKITPPADMRPKSKASSVVKPTNEEARRTAQANRLGAKSPVAPRVYENKAKKRVAKAKAIQDHIARRKASDKGYKQTGMDQVDMPRPKTPKLSPVSAAMTAKTEAEIKRVTKRQGMPQVEMSGVRRMPRKSMAEAGKEGWEALKQNVKGLWGAFTADQARRRGSNTGEAIKTASKSESSEKGQYNDEHMRSLQEMMPKVASAVTEKAPAPLNKAKPKKVPPEAPEQPLKMRDRNMRVPKRKAYEPSGPMERDNKESLNAYRDWAGSKLEKPDAFSQALSNLLGVRVTPGHQTTDSEGRLVMETSSHAKHTSKHPVAALREQKERKNKGWSNTAFPQK